MQEEKIYINVKFDDVAKRNRFLGKLQDLCDQNKASIASIPWFKLNEKYTGKPNSIAFEDRLNNVRG